MLELGVPLGLGVSLITKPRRIDDTVDRLVFRRRYREAVALRHFANESAFVTQPDTLLDLVVDQLYLHVGAPWVAVYEVDLHEELSGPGRDGYAFPCGHAVNCLGCW